MLSFSDACERNKDPILSILRDKLASSNTVLEIGSGTGQHAVYFARNLPHVTWQTSDVRQNLPGLEERLRLEGGDNIRAPLALDVRDDPWPTQGPFDAIYSANTLHIMDMNSVQLFFKGIGKILAPGGVLCVYGPFRYGGKYTSDSNAQFDKHLKMRDTGSGIRDFEAVNALAAAQGLALEADYRMPANNQTLVWRRPAAA
jgi:cyclopropane fatty-acyl-phospholipid synthase-like methyltransferase